MIVSSLAALGVAVGAMLVAFVTLVIMPIGPLGLTPHQMRWLWADRGVRLAGAAA